MISICIPTYNRAEQLNRLLTSIPNYDWIQICVSDNASPDHTYQVVELHNSIRKNKIKYFKHDMNVGLSRNVINSLVMGDCDHCLAITDDDYLLADGLNTIKKYASMNSEATHFFSCITYYEDSNRSEVSSYKKCSDRYASAANAIYRAHIHSGVLFKKDIIKATIENHREQIEGNIYVQYPFSAMAINSGKYEVHAIPVLIHAWENETFWGTDPSSDQVAKQYYQMIDYICEEIIDSQITKIKIENLIKRKQNIIRRAFRKFIRIQYFRTLEW
jgi:glycosyltransferase involved in cell wall biosynthesis